PACLVLFNGVAPLLDFLVDKANHLRVRELLSFYLDLPITDGGFKQTQSRNAVRLSGQTGRFEFLLDPLFETHNQSTKADLQSVGLRVRSASRTRAAFS